MGEKAKELSEKLTAFQNRVKAFVESCSEKGWKQVCDEEQWTVAATARHVAAGHYGIIEVAKVIIRGEAPPQLTMAQIIAQGNADAETYASCTKAEVMDILTKYGQAAADFVAGLDDEDLARSGHIPALGEISAGKLIEMVVLESAGGHLTSMEKATSA